MKAVIFDLDHTLFDRYATMTRCIPALFDLWDFAVSEEKATAMLIFADRNFTHKGWELMHEYLISEGMFRTPPTYDEFREGLFSVFRKTAVPFYFAIPTLARLREMGYKIGLITNGRSEVQRDKLKMLGLTNEFDEIIISGEFGVGKPSTEPFFEMSRRLGIPCNEMYYVGDNPKNDVDPARKAGFVPIWVNTTHTWIFPEIEKPELIVDDISELQTLIPEAD